MNELEEKILEFPEFITHVPQTKTKWIKIGYNKIHTGSHFSVRNALIGAMHRYLQKYIPENFNVKTPVEMHLIIYAPINYGSVRRIKSTKTGIYNITWKPPKKGYKPNWDIGNLAMVWLKCLDDVLTKKGVIPDDTISYIRKCSFEYKRVMSFEERKLVYTIKTIKNNK